MRFAPLLGVLALACAAIPVSYCTAENPESHVRRQFKQKPTWAQRFDRLGVLFERFGREVDDSVSDLWKDVTDKPETGLGRAARRVRREARDAAQSLEDAAQDAKWEIQKRIPRETFWSKFRRFLRKEKGVEVVSRKNKGRHGTGGEEPGKVNTEGWVEPKGGVSDDVRVSSPEAEEKKEEKNPGAFGVFAVQSIDDALEKLGEALQVKENSDKSNNNNNNNNGGDKPAVQPITIDLEKMKESLADAKDAFNVFVEKAQTAVSEAAEEFEDRRGDRSQWVKRNEQQGAKVNMPGAEEIEKAVEDVQKWMAKPAEEKVNDIDQFVDSIGERLIKQREAMAAQIKEFSAKFKKD